jgi:RNA polymerase sigma factor, sigma-70 family
MTVVAHHKEKDLLRLVSLGNETAFRALYDHYRPVVFTTAIRLIEETWTAEEVVQDTFLQVWLKRTELHNIENFPGWLYTIATNLTYNALTKKQRITKNESQLTPPTNAPLTPVESLLHKEYDKILEQAINRLPPKQKQTYILLKKEGKKREEAALELGVSPETVKWNLEQAMRSIRAYCMARESGLVMLLASGLAILKKIFL